MVVLDKLKDFPLIDSGGLEHLRARGCHGCEIGVRWEKEEEMT
jgi:hypothetical protein